MKKRFGVKVKKVKSPAATMITGKEKLIIRLSEEISAVYAEAKYQEERIQGRIRVAQALLDALKKGTLKP